MNCSKCGKEIPENSDFCIYCRNKVKSDNEDDMKERKTWKKNVKEFFSSKTFIIYTIIALGIIVYNYYTLRDKSFFVFLGIYCYLTVLCVIILPVWLINRKSINKQSKDETEIKEDINKEELYEYILASACFPIFKPQKIGDKQYLDGGMHDNVPVNMLLNKGYKNIIVIDISNGGISRRLQNKDAYIKIIDEYKKI